MRRTRRTLCPGRGSRFSRRTSSRGWRCRCRRGASPCLTSPCSSGPTRYHLRRMSCPTPCCSRWSQTSCGASRSSSSSSSCPTQADTAASSSQAWREACPPAARELQRAGLCNRGSFRKQLDGSAVQMPRGAIRQTLTRAASGLGLLPAGAHGPTPLPKPPMSLQREGEWELVFRQRNTAFTPVDITPRNTEDADADVFSRLDELERYRGVNARLIFKMVFPRCKEPNCNMWAQRTNPIRSFEIDGFERIKFAFDRDDKSDHAFNGLQLSRSDDILLHTYNPANPGACWYVIGSREPRFAGANGNKAESCVELYVLRPP
mmetsp:Transcript_71336/g.222534  ORF Transcript_71336/g.222534 Transcript_71336/m.222534 type:complete len:319 (+) Transcript_71336:229-1185(+)